MNRGFESRRKLFNFQYRVELIFSTEKEPSCTLKGNKTFAIHRAGDVMHYGLGNAALRNCISHHLRTVLVKHKASLHDTLCSSIMYAFYLLFFGEKIKM